MKKFNDGMKGEMTPLKMASLISCGFILVIGLLLTCFALGLRFDEMSRALLNLDDAIEVRNVRAVATSTHKSFEVVIIAFIPLGLVLIATSIITFFGIYKERPLFVAIGLLLVFGMIGVEFGLGIWGYINSLEANQTTDEIFRDSVTFLYFKNHRYRNVVDAVQLKFSCCGYGGLDDYINADPTLLNPGFKQIYPKSCCKQHSDICGVENVRSYYYENGCRNQINDHIEFMYRAFCVTILTCASIMVAALVLISMYMSSEMRSVAEDEEEDMDVKKDPAGPAHVTGRFSTEV